MQCAVVTQVGYTYFVDVFSLFQLSVNERRGAVKAFSEWNANDYLRYAHLPVKPHNDYYTISDIVANGQAINGEVISIMAVVKHVSSDACNIDFRAVNGELLLTYLLTYVDLVTRTVLTHQVA